MFNRLKEAVDDFGEVMIVTDSGQKHELHKHNTDFHENSKIVEVDADDKIHWLDATKIERYYIHKDF